MECVSEVHSFLIPRNGPRDRFGLPRLELRQAQQRLERGNDLLSITPLPLKHPHEFQYHRGGGAVKGPEPLSNATAARYWVGSSRNRNRARTFVSSDIIASRRGLNGRSPLRSVCVPPLRKASCARVSRASPRPP